MQEIYKGIEHLHLALSGAKKLLLVCGGSFQYLNIKKDVESVDVPFVKFDKFTPNPLYEDVCKGVDLFNSESCDTILAVGGGSAIDVAKCIKLYCKMNNDRLFFEQEYKDSGIKLIAVPTTAGTGSESTRFAVIYYGGRKQSVTHDCIIPNVAILEHKVLKTLPIYQRKCTMLDALCQGIESWWSVNSTDESKVYSKIAVETIMRWWREYIFENTDEAARYIMEAANCAGRAISLAQTTAPHAFSYKITTLYGFPHGHSVAVSLPVIWEYMLLSIDRCSDVRGVNYLENVFRDISKSMNVSSPCEAISSFKAMMSEMELQKPESKDRESDVKLLTNSVNPLRLKNNPVEIDFDAISKLYLEILS